MKANIRIRMYRTGFGDGFLVSFGSKGKAQHVLIDFGAHMHGEIGTMEPIMDDIETATGKKIAVVIATHAHRDHISGFGKFADRFSRFSIGQVWLPWTDNPGDPAADALQKKQLALYDRLETHLKMSPAAGLDPTHAAAMNALSNLRGNGASKTALVDGFGTGASVRYVTGGQVIDDAGVDGLQAVVLGPPKDKAFLSRMNPPANQRFLTAPGDPSTELRIFPQLEIRTADPDFPQLQSDGQPLLGPGELDELHALADVPAGRLALALDNVRNNTSIVVVFKYRGKSLLFPGDAQWGNWQSWIGEDSTKSLLGKIDFFKLAHHGSENATPVDVVNSLRAEGLAAMVPTQVEPFPTIPRLPLLTQIDKHCSPLKAVRSDWIDVDGAPSGPAPKMPLPAGFTAGEVWIDYDL